MSLQTIIQDAADRLGIPRPSSIIGTSDTQVRQLLGLAQQEGKELARRGDWETLTNESVFFATATETQASAIPADFDRFIDGSFWNRTQDRRVVGPLTPQRWQALKTGLHVSTWDSFRVRGSALLMNPTPNAGDEMAFEYISKRWCTSADGATARESWEADDDVPLLNPELITLGIIWRFLKAKGFDYSEAFRTYEVEVERRLASDGGTTSLDLNGSGDAAGVFDPFVPDGNWSL